MRVTDNSAPSVASSVPVAGQRLTAAVVLDIRLDDLSGVVKGQNVTLDGKPVQPGAAVGPGLSAGPRTLKVTGTDGPGNTGTRKMRFTSAAIGDAPADLTPKSGTTDAGGSVSVYRFGERVASGGRGGARPGLFPVAIRPPGGRASGSRTRRRRPAAGSPGEPSARRTPAPAGPALRRRGPGGGTRG